MHIMTRYPDLRKRCEEIATMSRLLRPQLQWTEEKYLAYDENRLVEFSNGRIEVLPMPTTSHQFIVAFLFALLERLTTSRNLGTTLFAALRIRLWRGKYREPEVVFMLREHADRIHEEWWDRA